MIPPDELSRMRGCVGLDFPVEAMQRLFGHISEIEVQCAAMTERAEQAEQGLVMWMETAKQARSQAFAQCAEIAEQWRCDQCHCQDIAEAIRAKAGEP